MSTFLSLGYVELCWNEKTNMYNDHNMTRLFRDRSIIWEANACDGVAIFRIMTFRWDFLHFGTLVPRILKLCPESTPKNDYWGLIFGT